MKPARITAGLLVATALFGSAAPAFARPTVIAELGTAPLLGSSSSTRQLQDRIARNEGVLSSAATHLGLSDGEFAQFHAAIVSGRVAWVTVPRHLDAMSWRSGPQVYVLHDVIIPAKTHGWEVDMPTAHGTLAVYMPATCGNMSILRKNAPAVAERPKQPTRVLAARSIPVAPVTPPVEAPPPVVAPPPAVVPPVAVAPPVVTAPAESEFPPAPAAVHHGFPLIPIILGGIAAALVGGGGLGPVTPGGAPTVPIVPVPPIGAAPTCP